MKKILFLTGVLFLSVSFVYSYPAFDVSPAASPLQFIQQQNFQKMEYNDYRQFKDAYDNPVESRNDSPEQLQSEFEIKNLKKPAKIQLGQPKEDSEMQLIQDNGQVRIKRVDD